MKVASTFGGWLKRRRGGLGLTQKELAHQVGYAEVTLRKVEADDLRPSRQMAQKLAEALQIGPEERAQFIKFARDEPGWDETALSTQTPPAMLPANQSNLLAPMSSFIGRDQEIQQLQQMLCRHDVRLVTLTGPGGIGKTRLGLEVAVGLRDHFTDGLFFVALASIDNPILVVSAIAQALGIRDPSNQLLESVKAHLHTKHLLLLLDNFEHLVAAAALVSELLQNCSRLSILVTSRSLLHVYGEHEYPVPPLTRPDLKQLGPGMLDLPRFLSQYAAVALFVQRAQAAKPGFSVTNANAPAVAEICVRLDGLPLAIELAAARSKLFPPQALLLLLGSTLGGRLQLLTGGAIDLPARQQTLRNTIAWSYDLLDKGEQSLFRRLCVFVGGFTLEAVEAVYGDMVNDSANSQSPSSPVTMSRLQVLEGIAALVDKNLLWQAEQAPPAGYPQPRCGMLETIREFGLEQLAASGEAEVLWQQYAHFYLALAEEAESRICGPEQDMWLERLEAEHDNLRAALDWCYRGDRNIDTGLHLANALWHYWRLQGYLGEGRAYLEGILALSEPSLSPSVYVQALARAGWLAVVHGDLLRADELCEQALLLGRAAGEKWSIGLACNVLGTIARANNQPTTASVLYEEALTISREIGDLWLIALSLANYGVLAFLQEKYQQAIARIEEALVLFHATGDRFYVGGMLDLVGRIARQQGNYQQARHFFRKGLDLDWNSGNVWGLARSLSGLAGLCAETGEAERAARLFGAEAMLRKLLHAGLVPAIISDHEHTLDIVRKQLDTATFTAAWEAGQAMTKEQAAAYAREIIGRDENETRKILSEHPDEQA
jgi:predicted ATPase/DNA-binding XRE family transcriptional regulator